VAQPDDKKAAPSAAPAPTLPTDEVLKASFSFKPVPNPSDPTHPKTNAHLLIQGSKPMDIDLGNFASPPDVVNEAKAKLASFPNGMIMGFRSYQPSSGISSDLAVLHVNGRHLRIVQRRVDETAAEPGRFETAREVPMPINTKVVACVPGKEVAFGRRGSPPLPGSGTSCSTQVLPSGSLKPAYFMPPRSSAGPMATPRPPAPRALGRCWPLPGAGPAASPPAWPCRAGPCSSRMEQAEPWGRELQHADRGAGPHVVV
jgi:hypothetical protein